MLVLSATYRYVTFQRKKEKIAGKNQNTKADLIPRYFETLDSALNKEMTGSTNSA